MKSGWVELRVEWRELVVDREVEREGRADGGREVERGAAEATRLQR